MTPIEWFEKTYSGYNITHIRRNSLMKEYANYLVNLKLEAFAEDVKENAKLIDCNNGKGCGIPYCEIHCETIDKRSIDEIKKKYIDKL